MPVSSETLLNRAGTSKAVIKGQGIFERGHIKIEFCNYKGLTASVRSPSGNEFYDVSVEFNEEGDDIKFSSCSCLAFKEYGGICKHIVAAILFMQQQNLNQKRSDLCVNKILNQYTKRILNEVSNANAELQPTLNYSHDGTYLTFKIGSEITKRMYVVRSLFKLKYSLESNETCIYGKNFSLIHDIAQFKPENREIVNFFLQNWDEYNHRYSPESFFPDKSRMYLSPEMLDKYTDIVSGSEFLISSGGNLGIYNVTDENFPFRFAIKSDKNEDGFLLKLNNRELCYKLKGRKHIYVISEGKFFRCSEECSDSISPLIEEIFKTEDKKIFLIKEDIPAFISNVFKKIENYVEIKISKEIYELKPPPLITKVYFDKYGENGASAKMTFFYEDESHDAFEKKPTDKIYDLSGELVAKSVLTKYMGSNMIIEDNQDALFLLLFKGMEEISKFSEIYISDELKNTKIRQPMSGKIGVKVNNGLLNINFDFNEFNMHELMEVLNSYNKAKKYHRFKDGSFISLEDGLLKTVSEIAEGLDLNSKELVRGKIKVPVNRAFYVNSLLKSDSSIQFERDKEFKKLVRDFYDISDADYEIPASLKDTLRSYQKTGYLWMKILEKFKFGGILADDMGLGKTIQVLTFLLSCKLENKSNDIYTSIVICPASLSLNWESEAKRFTPELNVVTINGSASERSDKLSKALEYDLVVTSYDYIKRDIEKYENIKFKYIIIDEAQYIKNQNTQNAKSVKSISGDTRFALTGTPIENSLAELWSIFDFLMPGYLHNYNHFRKKYEVPIVKNQNQNITDRLHSLVSPFIIRRLKCDVLKELPNKTESIVKIEMDESQRKIYVANLAKLKKELAQGDRGLTEAQKRVKVLAALTRIRQICCDPSLVYENYSDPSAKTNACIEIIKSSINSEHRILLFSQFTSMLDIIQSKLDEIEVKYFRLDGSTPTQKRLEMVNNFNNGDAQIFLISLKAGGTGLNLIGADVVIHYDPWWNVSAQNQATDRAYRIGQTRNVTVYKLIIQNTIEERILEMQERKNAIANSVVKQGEETFNALSREKLMELFEVK